MSVIGQALIDVRPDMGKFKTQVRSGIGEAVKFAAGAFAVGGAVEFFKSSIEGAVQLQEVTRRLDTSLKAIGADTQHTRDRADSFLKTLQSTSQFTRADLTDSLNRAVIGLGSFRKGMELTNLTANVARARGKDLAETQTALQRVFAGNVGSLRRLGIAFTATTPNTTALKDKLAELKTKLDAATGSEKDHIKQLIEVAKGHAAAAKAADKRAAVEQAIALLHKRFGEGVADFANTAAGRIAKLQNDLRSLQVEIGTALLPAVEAMVAQGLRFVDWLKTLGPAITTVAGDLAPLAGFLRDVGNAIGAVPILAAVGTFLAFSKAVSVASSISAGYAATAARLAAAQTAAAASAAGLAAAQEAQTVAAGSAAIAEDAVAASTVAAGAAATEAAAGIGVFDVALAAVGGPIGLAIVGIAGLVAGLVYLSGQEDALATATRKASDALKGLGDAIDNVHTDAATAKTDALTVAQDRLSVHTARLAEHEARRALQNTNAAKGTDEYRRLTDSLKQAQLGLAEAQNGLSISSDRLAGDRQKGKDDNKALTNAVNGSVKSVLNLAGAAVQESHGWKLVAQGRKLVREQKILPTDAGAAFDSFLAKLDKLRAGQKNLIVQHNLDLLDQFTRKLGHVPSPKLIKLALSGHDANETLNQFILRVTGLGGLMTPKAAASGVQIGQGLAQGVISGIQNFTPILTSTFAQTIKDTAAAGKAATQINSPSKLTRDTIGLPLAEGVAVGILQGKKNVIGAMRSTIIDAVTSAKQGLAGLASSLAGTVGQLLDARLASSPQGKALAAAQAAQAKLDYAQQLADAKAAVDATVAGSKERAKAEADLAVLVAQHNYDAAAAKEDAQKTSDERILADLADALNRGLITQKTYQQRVTALLKSQGVTYSAAGKALGLAFADGFLAELQDMLKQANAVVQVGLPGSGLNTQVTSPLDAIRQGVRDARKQLRDDEKAAKDSGGPGGKKITAAEHRQILHDEKMLKALERLEKAAKRIVIENLNISAGSDATARKLAEELINELAAAAAV